MLTLLKNIFRKKEKIDWDAVKESLEPKISSLKKPAVRIIKSAQKSNSKFGGRPLVEKDNFIWPESKGKPMAFLAQIDLAEISAQYDYEWLNSEGSLLFFYDVFEMPWGFDPKDRGKWQVLYQKSPDILPEFPSTLDKKARIKESYMKPKRVEVYPNFDDVSVEQLNLSDEEGDLYCDISCGDDSEPVHQVGGFPSPVQGNYMDLESQLVSNGIYLGDSKGYESPEAKALEEGAKDWQLLLQFDSDEGVDVMWGDGGMLYFWVQEDKAKNNQFDNCWLILQCC